MPWNRPLRTLAVALVIVNVDISIDGQNFLADIVGWLLMTLGLLYLPAGPHPRLHTLGTWVAAFMTGATLSLALTARQSAGTDFASRVLELVPQLGHALIILVMFRVVPSLMVAGADLRRARSMAELLMLLFLYQLAVAGMTLLGGVHIEGELAFLWVFLYLVLFLWFAFLAFRARVEETGRPRVTIVLILCLIAGLSLSFHGMHQRAPEPDWHFHPPNPRRGVVLSWQESAHWAPEGFVPQAEHEAIVTMRAHLEGSLVGETKLKVVPSIDEVGQLVDAKLELLEETNDGTHRLLTVTELGSDLSCVVTGALVTGEPVLDRWVIWPDPPGTARGGGFGFAPSRPQPAPAAQVDFEWQAVPNAQGEFELELRRGLGSIGRGWHGVTWEIEITPGPSGKERWTWKSHQD